MKILETCAVSFTFDRFILPIAEGLAINGHSVTTCFSGKSAYLSKFDHYSVSFPRSFKPIALCKSFLDFLLILRSDNYDCVHVHTPLVSYIVRLACLLSGTPCIYHCHGFPFHKDSPKIEFITYFFAEYFFHFFTHSILFVSQDDFAFASRYFLPGQTKFFNVRNGVDPELFSASQVGGDDQLAIILDRYGFNVGLIDDNTFLLLCVGRLVPEKGFDLIFKVVNHIVNDQNLNLDLNFKLLVIGSPLSSDRDKSLSNTLNKLILDYPDCIYNLPFVENSDLPFFYSISSCFLNPSFREGLPTTTLESLLTGTFTIASNIRGNRELLEQAHPDSCMLIDGPSYSSIANAIHYAIKQKADRNIPPKTLLSSLNHQLLSNYFLQSSVALTVQAFNDDL